MVAGELTPELLPAYCLLGEKAAEQTLSPSPVVCSRRLEVRL